MALPLSWKSSSLTAVSLISPSQERSAVVKVNTAPYQQGFLGPFQKYPAIRVLSPKVRKVAELVKKRVSSSSGVVVCGRRYVRASFSRFYMAVASVRFVLYTV